MVAQSTNSVPLDVDADRVATSFTASDGTSVSWMEPPDTV